MTFSEKKNLLEALKTAKYIKDKAQEKVDEMRSDYGALTTNYSGIKINNRQINSVVERAAERIENALEEFAKTIEIYYEKAKQVEEAISSLPKTERSIIEDFYGKGKSAISISIKYNYNERTIYKIRDRAIRKLNL